jgi:oligopeptide/dipeptide ABC transporter ATP-binding protein
LGLVGESGSGKTTTGRCILRLDSLTGGELHFRGVPISSISINQYRRYRSQLQIVFQNPFENLNPRWTVRQTLKEPLDLHTRLSTAEKSTRISELMELIGLDKDFIDCRPKELSAGARQRVAIARALATNPEFIVLDEPTSALAPDAENEIIKLLIDLQQRLGLSYLYISHDLSTVKYLCHRVAVMYLSQIVEIGQKDLIFNTPLHPYSQGLLASVVFPDTANRRVERSREEREVLKGEIPSPINLPKGCYLYGRCPIGNDVCQNTPQTLESLDDGRLIRCWRVSKQDLPMGYTKVATFEEPIVPS